MGNLLKCCHWSSGLDHQTSGRIILFLISTHFQANSILASDRTISKKVLKKDDFLEDENILNQALTANPCDGSTASGEPEPSLCYNLTHIVAQVCLRLWPVVKQTLGAAASLWLRIPQEVWRYWTRWTGARQLRKTSLQVWFVQFKAFFSGSDFFLSQIKLQSWSTARRRLQDLSAVNVCKIWMNPMQIGSR